MMIPTGTVDNLAEADSHCSQLSPKIEVFPRQERRRLLTRRYGG